MSIASEHTILICARCKGAGAAKQLRARMAQGVPDGFVFRPVDCMAGCDRPVTVGMNAPGKAQYLFGDIETQEDADALAQFALQYLDSDTGWTSATDRPQALYRKTLARLPGPRGVS